MSFPSLTPAGHARPAPVDRVTVFEHDSVPFDWTTADVDTLARLRQAVGVDVLAADNAKGRRVLRAGSFVGVVRLGRYTVELLPKLFRATDPGPARPAAAGRTVMAMLAYALGLPPRRVEDAPVELGLHDWFEALTRAFARGLAAEWARGPARGYVPVEDDLPAVRGRFRVRDHLARPGRHHVLPLAFDEFTADTRLNRAFRYVVEQLWEQSRDPDNRRLLAGLRDRMGEVTLVPALPPAVAPPSLITRLTARFGPAFALARLFLTNLVPLPAAGLGHGFAFVLDMNKLFEGFLLGFLTRHKAVALPPGLAACRLLPQTAGAGRTLAVRDDGTPVFGLRPDLAFAAGDRFPALADAKYKRLDPAATASGVGQDDFYQAAAYAARYDCPRVVLVYPQLTPAAVRARFRLLTRSDQWVEAVTVELRDRLWTPAGRRGLADELRGIFGGADEW